MNIRVLDTSLNAVYIIDDYESFIWTDRYYSYGDFELYTNVNREALGYLQKDYYITNDVSDHVMIIEKTRIESDVENGDHVTVSGRSLESILDRRIVWGKQTVSGNLQNAIKALLDNAIINPSDIKRKVSNFVFEYSTDPSITSMTINAQYTGDNLYEVINSICLERGIGFKITIVNDQFVFKLYNGVDRSDYVVFSEKFDNIINSNYYYGKNELKNIALVAGEGEGSDRVYASAIVDDQSGLDRREMFVDARDIQSEQDGVIIDPSDYQNLLIQRGKEKLSEFIEQISFEGQAETTIMFRYGEDFSMGDIVHIENEYGIGKDARIIEFIVSDDEEGFVTYPTFEAE